MHHIIFNPEFWRVLHIGALRVWTSPHPWR